MSHTPGPWEIDKDGWTIWEYIDDDPGGESGAMICTCYDNRENNIRLIAAAPDLLAELEKMTGATQIAFDSVFGLVKEKVESSEVIEALGPMCRMLIDARTAIAKATGKSIL